MFEILGTIQVVCVGVSMTLSIVSLALAAFVKSNNKEIKRG